MIIICTGCGEEPRNGRCRCDERDDRAVSHLEAVVATAASMGGVDERTLREAARALREKAS